MCLLVDILFLGKYTFLGAPFLAKHVAFRVPMMGILRQFGYTIWYVFVW